MAVTGSGFGITFGIYAAVLVGVFLAFSFWSRLPFTKRFYAPKRYKKELEPGYSRPPPVPSRLGGWIPWTIRLTEDQVVSCAGVDALCYLKLLRMGWELFLLVSFVTLAIILPINLTGGYVDDLIGSSDPNTRSAFTFWLPPATESSDSEEPDAIAPPPIYVSNLPDPPAGLTWWEYLPGIPPLPTPEDYYNNASYASYGWRYDDNYVTVNYVFTGLDKTSMANIPEKSDKLYAHAVITWVVTLITMWQCWRYCKVALRLRIYHLLQAPTGAETHTVLVTDIPGVPRGTIFDRLSGPLLKLVPKKIKQSAASQLNSDKMDPESENPSSNVDEANPGGGSSEVKEMAKLSKWVPPDRWMEAKTAISSAGGVHNMVQDEFSEVYGKDEVSDVQSTFVTGKLDSLFSSYESVKTQAISAIDVAVTRHRAGKKMKPKKTLVLGPKFGQWGREKYGDKPVKVNSYEFMRERMDHLRSEIESAQSQSKEEVQPSAFVTFRSRRSQVVASGALMSEDLTTWRCQPAPRPDEIVWQNVGMRTWERSVRSMTMSYLFVLFTIFFLIPVAALQALLSTPSLVSWIEDIPIFGALLTGVLPGLALVILLALVPPIIRWMLIFSGRTSESQIDAGMISRYFGFQVVTTFFGSFIAGSFANQFKQLIEDPGSIVNILGTAAPQTAIFFTTFLMAEGMFAGPLGLLRFVGLVFFWIKNSMASTPRAKENIISEDPFLYGAIVPNDTIAILLGLTFSCIFPIICPIALIYFSTMYLMKKYELCYIHTTAYQSGGAFWPQVFWQVFTGLIIFQLMMIAILAIKETIAPPLIVLPLPFLTILYSKAVTSTFFPPMKNLSMIAAADRDEADRKKDQDVGMPPESAYKSPSFSLDGKEHDEIVSELQTIAQAQDAGNYDSLSSIVMAESENFETPAGSDDEVVDVEAGTGAGAHNRTSSEREGSNLLKTEVSGSA